MIHALRFGYAWPPDSIVHSFPLSPASVRFNAELAEKVLHLIDAEAMD